MAAKIWDLQLALNKLIKAKVKMPISQTMYIDQIRNEAAEAKDRFYHKWWVKEVQANPDLFQTIIPSERQGLIVELIDILHFLVSEMQSNGSTAQLQLTFAEDFLAAFERKQTITEDKDAYHALNFILGCTFSSDGRDSCLKALTHLLKYMGLTPAKVLSIYEAKHAANLARQATGYAQATKTEADNKAIESEIKTGKGWQLKGKAPEPMFKRGAADRPTLESILNDPEIQKELKAAAKGQRELKLKIKKDSRSDAKCQARLKSELKKDEPSKCQKKKTTKSKTR
jgi:hypothetical protein